MLSVVAAAILAVPAPAAGPAPDPVEQTLEKAANLVQQKQPAQALALIEAALSSFDKPVAEASAKGAVYCATSPQEILLYSVLSANRKTSGTVLGAHLCDALFLKAYTLTELKREAEAVATLERLTALAPMHAHYFVELGFAYRVTGATDKAMAAYRAAVDHAGDASLPDAKLDRAAALRGIGYLLIDKNDLDGAAASYRKSLEDDPNSAIAKSELDYIDGLRKKSR
jgi:tetratricopeptide (TPR) repeat protein